jgi:hypothetical protein
MGDISGEHRRVQAWLDFLQCHFIYSLESSKRLSVGDGLATSLIICRSHASDFAFNQAFSVTSEREPLSIAAGCIYTRGVFIFYLSLLGDSMALYTSPHYSAVLVSRLKTLESLGGASVFHVESEGVGAGVADVDPEADEVQASSR